MIKLRTYLFCILSLLIADIEASVSQGKDIYATACQECHLNGKYLASKKSAQEWKILIESDKLSQLHLRDEGAKTFWSYFEGETYQKETKHLKDFLQKYSSDRGKHNSCN